MLVYFPEIWSIFPSAERLGVEIGSCCWRAVLFNLAKKHWEWILETLGDALTSYDILDFATSALKQ